MRQRRCAADSSKELRRFRRQRDKATRQGGADFDDGADTQAEVSENSVGQAAVSGILSEDSEMDRRSRLCYWACSVGRSRHRLLAGHICRAPSGVGSAEGWLHSDHEWRRLAQRVCIRRDCSCSCMGGYPDRASRDDYPARCSAATAAGPQFVRAVGGTGT